MLRGDLFDQEDANLVVGFSDTFDTSTDDVVISRESVQGQLVDRLFDGRHRLLDAALRRGLKDVIPLATESVRAKRRGRRTRYPIGTAVAVPVGKRRVFALAYSRLGNDLRARSAPADLRLEPGTPVAVGRPARPVQTGGDPADRRGPVPPRRARPHPAPAADRRDLHPEPGPGPRRLAPSSRVVIRADELERTDLSAVEAFLRRVDERGPALPPTGIG